MFSLWIFMTSQQGYCCWEWWLTCIIAATQEAAIWRIMVQGQAGQKLVSPYFNQQAGYSCMCLPPSYTGSIARRLVVPDQPGPKTKDPIQKITKEKQGGEGHGRTPKVLY
jgi:hypothetical protein